MRKPETAAEAKRRHLALLETAYRFIGSGDAVAKTAAPIRYAEIHAVLRATLPGKQTDQNTRDALDKAVRAVVRRIRTSEGYR